MKHQYTFHFCQTEKEAKAFCQKADKATTYYMRKHHPAHYTPWESQDRKEHLFVVWYYI